MIFLPKGDGEHDSVWDMILGLLVVVPLCMLSAALMIGTLIAAGWLLSQLF